MKREIINSLRSSGVVAVIRTETPEDLIGVARALSEGGVKFVEITMTIPGALDIIQEAVAQLKGTKAYIGAGTVLDAATARAAIIAGAQFVVGPGFDRRNRQGLQHLRSCGHARRLDAHGSSSCLEERGGRRQDISGRYRRA